MIYYEKGLYDRAIADFSRVIELKPHEEHTFYDRGRAYHKGGNHDQAIADFSKCIKAGTLLIGAYEERASVYRDKGDFVRAERDIAEARALRSNTSQGIDLTRAQELIDAVRAAFLHAQQNCSAATRESVLAGPHGACVRKAFESVCEECRKRRTQRIILPMKNVSDPIRTMIIDLFKSPSKVSSNVQVRLPFELEFRG